MLLYFLGVLPEIGAELDAIEIPIGKQPCSLLAIGKAIVVVVLTLGGHAVAVEPRRTAAAAARGTRQQPARRLAAKAVRALLLVVAVLIALQAVGIDLTLLSVFGGALGVGIGLGLQKLASNYIAGFTILLDRSIRLGDMITVDNRFGVVDQGDLALRRRAQPRRRRGDRAQRDAGHDDRAQPLVHDARRPASAIPVQVSYDSDLDSRCAADGSGARPHPRVLKTPNAPAAFVVRFADSGIDLELGVWIDDPENGQLNLRSAINRAIWRAFRANGIRIPYPQREVRIVDAPAPRPARARPAERDRPPAAPPCRLTRPRSGRTGAGATRQGAAIGVPYNERPYRQTGPSRRTAIPMPYDLLDPLSPRPDAAAVVGLRRRHAGADPHHHRRRHDLSAPPSAHRALDLHPAVSHFFRFWLWLTTGMVTKEWTAIHRKHHAKCETAEDPHSPQMLRHQEGAAGKAPSSTARKRRTRKRSRSTATARPTTGSSATSTRRTRGKGIAPDADRQLRCCSARSASTIWAVQMMWIPITAAGIINGVGHYWGYRNFQPRTRSTNIVPWGILIGGEELHNNHHAYASSAKLSSRWYEFDIGWIYIRMLEMLEPRPGQEARAQVKVAAEASRCDLETLQAVITHRYDVLAPLTRARLRTTCADEIAAHARTQGAASRRRAERATAEALAATDDAKLLPERERATLDEVLSTSKVLTTVYSMRQELATLWQRSTANKEQLLAPAGRLVPSRRDERHRSAARLLPDAALLRLTREGADASGYAIADDRKARAIERAF